LKLNGKKRRNWWEAVNDKHVRKRKKYLYLLFAAMLVILTLLALPRRKVFRKSGEEMLSRINRKTHIISPHRFREMQAGGQVPQLVDLRDREAYAVGHLPGAVNLPAEGLDPELIHRFFRSKGSVWVLYAAETYEAEKYWILFTQMGMEHLFVLETGSRLDSLIQQWDVDSSRMIMMDEIPAFTFRPDSSTSF
jgi:rhodanese-related sulfurtransferase